MKQLTPEQSQMVEKNHKLIYGFLKKRGLLEEDWYGIAAYGLCKAAMIFDPDREVKFSVLAYTCMDNEVRMEMRKNRKLVSVAVSLDDECSALNGDDCGTVADKIADTEDFRRSVEIRMAIDQAMQTQSNRNREISELYFLENCRQESIALGYGISRSYVSRIVTKFAKKVKENMAISEIDT